MASCGSLRVDKNTPIMVTRRRGKTTRGAGNFSGGGGKLRGSLPPPPPHPDILLVHLKTEIVCPATKMSKCCHHFPRVEFRAKRS